MEVLGRLLHNQRYVWEVGFPLCVDHVGATVYAAVAEAHLTGTNPPAEKVAARAKVRDEGNGSWGIRALSAQGCSARVPHRSKQVRVGGQRASRQLCRGHLLGTIGMGAGANMAHRNASAIVQQHHV